MCIRDRLWDARAVLGHYRWGRSSSVGCVRCIAQAPNRSTKTCLHHWPDLCSIGFQTATKSDRAVDPEMLSVTAPAPHRVSTRSRIHSSHKETQHEEEAICSTCLLYTSPSPRDRTR